MYVLPVGALDVVPGCRVEHGDAQILIHLLPDRSALDLKHREEHESKPTPTEQQTVSNKIKLTLSNPPSLCTSL